MMTMMMRMMMVQCDRHLLQKLCYATFKNHKPDDDDDVYDDEDAISIRS